MALVNAKGHYLRITRGLLEDPMAVRIRIYKSKASSAGAARDQF